MKQFVYFFKHKNVNAVKIGKTSGESVLSRFNDFKTYSPFGAEILGFTDCKNCNELEKECHNHFKEFRLYGEWFNISQEQIDSFLNNHDKSYREIKNMVIEYLSADGNNPEKLKELIKKSFTIENENNYNPDHLKIYRMLPDQFSLKEANIIAIKNNINIRMFNVFIFRKTGSWFIKASRGNYKKNLNL